MKSMHLIEAEKNPALVEVDVPRPMPRKGEVLIRVRAAGVTPTEVAWYPTSHTRDGEERAGAVPSHEFSGEIAYVGDAIEGLSPGQEIYGMNDWFADGALAEYCITQPGWIAPKPQSLGHAAAASIPIGALTAWQGLFERAKLQRGERVLVHGGAGAVGAFAVQLARLHGARVIATVSARDLEFVKELGADEALDYKAGPFEERVRNIDVVFDAVGGQTLQRSWGVLNCRGRLVTIASNGEVASDERIKHAFFIVEPHAEQLVEIAKLLDLGDLRTFVRAVLPLSQASDAYAGRVEKSGRGKLVITIPET
ncbi:MAG: NADP-dependent oxidoreductase [Acidobacteriota bacterium]|nr:NADP-dependent oxidoreductase [Acidobacteriota bacterium]